MEEEEKEAVVACGMVCRYEEGGGKQSYACSTVHRREERERKEEKPEGRKGSVGRGYRGGREEGLFVWLLSFSSARQMRRRRRRTQKRARR